MKKLLLIDAYALIYRSYYAFINAPRINSKGLNTSAIYGFVNTLEEIVRKENPSHVAVAFDPSGKTFRHEAFEAYKAQREATPEDIRKSIPYIKELIAAYNIPIIEVAGFEADDVIGTLSKKAEERGFDTYMFTPDKDYAQLVSEHIFMYRPRHNGGYEILGVPEVLAKYELADQMQVIDLLGLMGDSSDNIPGCPGVGPKTAVKLLAQFGSIENMLAHTDEIKGALRTKIEDNRQQIGFSKFLATIRTDVPVDFDEEALKVCDADGEKLQKLFAELEFSTFARRRQQNTPESVAPVKPAKARKDSGMMDMFEMFAAQEQQPEPTTISVKSSIASVPHTYTLIDTEVALAGFVGKLSQQKLFCFDTETTDVDVMKAKLVGLSFSWKEGEAWYIACNRIDTDKVLASLKDIFADDAVTKIGQNMKYDISVLANYGVAVNGPLFDTMLAHYVLQPELHHGMDYLAEVYLNYNTIHYEDLVGAKGRNQKLITDIDPQKVCDYSGEDADVTFRLYNILKREIEEQKLEKLFYDIEMPLVTVLSDMERAGARIDSEALKASSEILTARMRSIEEEVCAVAGDGFNINSPRQIGELLFERLKVTDKAKKTKTGQYITSEDVLEPLRSKHEVVAKILDYRGIKKLVGTYIDALPELVNPVTGKIHTSYNQAVTATGRLSSSNPNLQNIPVREEMGREIRKAFIPDDGCLFLSADYSQIELRLMAHLSGDANMIEAFNSGADIHAATAAKIYNVPIDEVTKDMRRKAKTANFGIIYGISVFGLAERLGIQRSEAKELIDGYFATYPRVRMYMDESVARAKSLGYVETIFGRKRYLPDINSANSVVRGYAERNAINAPIQGSAADLIKIAMIRIASRLKAEGLRAQMIVQVHDELNFSVPEQELDRVREIVVGEMAAVASLSVPLIADCGVGANWLEAH